MMHAQPTVSVVMATYNAEKYIREQLDSILAQTYPVYELIIQDDCSTDSTPAICREYEAKYPCVHFFENEHNLGFNLNFKTAAMRATGDLIALSDDDDIWFKEKIEKQVSAIGEHDMCTCAICRGDILEHAVDEPYSDDPRPGTHIFRCILGHSMLVKRELLQESKNWDGAPFFDWSLTLHADWGKGIARVNEVLVFHRAHKGSYTSHQLLKAKKHSGLTPFFHGLKYFRRLQALPKFTDMCRYICMNTEGKKGADIKLQHSMASLMLSKSLVDYIRLCLLCMVHRKQIYYPLYKAYGVKGAVRSFFYPALSAYYSAFNFE